MKNLSFINYSTLLSLIKLQKTEGNALLTSWIHCLLRRIRRLLSGIHNLSQGRLIFGAFLYAIIYLFFMLQRLYMKNCCQSRSRHWLVRSAGSILLGGKVYFGPRPFSLLCWSLSLDARLHINTAPDYNSSVFFM